MEIYIMKKLSKAFERPHFVVLNWLLTAFIIGFLQGCTAGNENGSLKLGDNGNLNYIVVPDHSGQVVQFAASELKTYLKKITGKELQILEESDTKGKKGIIQLHIEKNKSLKWDGFTIEITRKQIRLLSGESRGLLYAVYCLLEEAGCSFFYPGEQEEIVPLKDEILFNPRTVTCNPILEHRGLTPYGLYAGSVDMGRKFIDWMAKNRLNFILVSEDRPTDADGQAHSDIWKDVEKDLLPELQKRGFVIDLSEHCMPVFFPRSLFKDHPDWCAMNNGVRKAANSQFSGQICYSNKDAVEYYAASVAEYAAKHPEFHIIGTWPLDGGNYCECEDCKDPETVFKAAMRVAEKVREVRPDMIVEHLAYKVQTWQPPSMKKIPDNMSVMWCPGPGKMDSLAREWINKASGGGVYQFEYYMGDNYRMKANVWLRPEYSAEEARYASEMGFRGVVSLFLPIQNWWRASFNTWFFARACWDKDLDIESNLRKYCQDYYGVQGAAIEQVFNLIFNDLQQEPYKDQRWGSAVDTAGIKASAKSILSKLDSISNNTTEKDVAIRIKRLRTYVEYFQLHCETLASRNPEYLERLSNYSKQRPDQQMVLMYPEYIIWRNR